MPSALQWFQIKQQGQKPSPRSGHSITTIGRLHYLFGGIDLPKQGKVFPSNQVYTLKISSTSQNPNNCQWALKPCSGDIPYPRACHSACKLNDERLLIFGGNGLWFQPPNQKSQGQPRNAQSKIGAPQPRANHSATYHKNKVYVFGGHGGTDFKRTSFNDLYQLNCQTFDWQLLSPSGTPPDPRGGHSATMMANKDKLMIFGGWSSITQFTNIMIYDITKNAWQDLELNHQIAKWNLGAIITPSIPSWKYFIFGGSVGNFIEGGNRTGTKFVDDTCYMDIQRQTWHLVNLQQNQKGVVQKPKARQSPALFYSNDDQRLYMFGGWSNNWLGDLWCLPIGLITGPPYAIFQIKPKLGPVTGKTKVSIFGDGYLENLGQITVRFQGQKGYIDVQGTFCSNDTLTCQTPSFEQYGPRKVEVRICFGKLDFTITSQSFTYFLNSKADKCIAYGPGLLMENLIGLETCFLIQARNIQGKNRQSGSDQFVITIRRTDIVPPENPLDGIPQKKLDSMNQEQKKAMQQQKQQMIAEYEQKINILYTLTDNEDGSYLIKYKMDEESKVQIDIQYKNQKDEYQPIRGNKFKGGFSTEIKPKNNQINGPQMTAYVLSQLKQIGEFLQISKQNIQIRNKSLDGNVKELLKVMQSLNQIEMKKDQISLTLDVIDQILKTFEKHHQMKREGELKKTHKLQQEIKALNNMASLVDKGITSNKVSQGQKTKQNIKKFQQQLKQYFLHLKKQSFYLYLTGVQNSFKRIEEVNQQLDDFQTKLKDYNFYQVMFKFEQNETGGCHKILDQIKHQVKTMTRLWQHIKVCQNRFQGYLKIKWIQIDCGQIEDEIKKLRNGLIPIKVSDRKCSAFVGITEDIKRWATTIPMVADLRDPSMNTIDERHWKKVKEQVKQNFEVDENLYLQKIWNLKLYDRKEKIQEITEMAKNEAKMENQLKKVISFWKDIEFELIPHKNTEIRTLKMLDDHFDILEQHQNTINTMLTSKYVAYFEKEVETWKQDLGSIYDVIQLLGQVQKTWSFLQNLFIHSEEVKKQLPSQSQMFISIDKEMKQAMEIGQKQPNILKFCTIQGMVKRLEKIQKQLKVCQKALNDFLDSKRRFFPRFYFVSVNDLLDILSNGNSPSKINRHMAKIFQAIQMLQLSQTKGQQRPKALSMKSCVGVQQVDLVKPLHLLGKVEIYLQDMIQAMNQTLKTITQNSLKNKQSMEREQWLKKDPAQITLLVNNITWSFNTESCLKKITQGTNVNAMKEYYQSSIKLLTDLIKMVQGKLDTPVRQKIMCLITMDTHSRDVIDKLIHQNVKKIDAFQWQSQLKFYWETSINNAQIRIADAKFIYNYQYLGNGPRLVVTPLTDRIYVTATQALHLKMGCAPAGPAGTGKTQTTKDLANCLAKACYVFNCSSQMNYESMGNIYKGLASSGCWGCFDQFNRLLPQVLSVCSVQFKSVTDAIKEKKQRFILQGDQISLNVTCGVFITMNPGYLGRAQLPEGLKALFRPITVVVPDLQLICQNMLMAEGFVQAKVLAKKFVTLYMLCKDLLSKQAHYDWGLRAIKSVLVVAGSFKRGQPDVGESALLMRALRDFNLPKIAFADLEIFFGLLRDLFPGINIPRKVDQKFQKVIEDVTIQNNLHIAKQFVLKVVQLSQLLQIRHCVFIMGPPGAGKTSTWKILGKSQDKIQKKTTIVDINPKTVSTKDLYGYNLPTKQWKDGLLSKMLRTLSQMEDTNPKWLMLDGDLDANWIESMNSVMDDNKILTLANNQRIPLKPHMRMLFQIRDLRYATPATVSRAGILYISDDEGYQWRSYVQSWLGKTFSSNQNANLREDLNKLFQKYVNFTLLYIKKHCKTLVPVSQMSMIISLCKILGSLLKDDYKHTQYPFVFAIVWAVGGCLAQKDAIDYRKEFSNWWKSEWKSVVKFPSKGTIFDYYIGFPKGQDSPEQSKLIEEWQNVPVQFDTSRGDTMGNLTVPTKQTIAAQFFIKRYIFIAHPILMIGFAGCGKTQLAKGILRSIVQQKPQNYSYQLINFNYYTDSTYLQTQLQQTLRKIAGRQYGPPGKQKLIYFIDDLNMPQLDPYDTQTAISLLRQHADYQHWYDIHKLSLKDIINTQTLASMNPSAGSFFVNPRYQRHFWTVSIPFPDAQSLFTIYSTFLNGHIKRFKQSIQELSPYIIRSALTIHQSVISSFRKTAINFHYEFNLRHLSNVFQGILLSDQSRFSDPQKFVKLWIHQSQRTYGDRLVSQDNLQKYNSSMFELLKKSFPRFQLQKYFQQSNPQNLIFCDFTQGMNAGQRFYDIMPNDKLFLNISQGLHQYNSNNAMMNLVLFEDAMKHVCRITRIINPSSGHALLVGVGGSGKQSLSKLSAFMMFLTTYMITINSTYNMNDLKNDLQFLYNKTGIKQEGYLFLFNQGQITNQRFLVYLNDLLSSGQIADLYTTEEKDLIINNVRSKVKGEGKQDTKQNCWNYFIDKVKEKLHMSLCFSPVGDALRRRSRQFPALVNCTVIDWFFPWPKDALYDVAKNKLQELQLGQQEIRNGIISFMPYSFQIVNNLSQKLFEQERRHVYTTPKSFLELIKLFETMLQKKMKWLFENKERYQTGLQKLKSTAQEVVVIEEEVKLKQIEAEEKKISADAFAAKVGVEREKVEIENNKAKDEEAKCQAIKKDVEEKKAITQKELSDAEPLVEKAQESLKNIEKKDFTNLKAFASPPTGIPEVMYATMWIIAGFFPDLDVDKNKRPKIIQWKTAQKMMKNPETFKNFLIDFRATIDANLVSKYNVDVVKKDYLSDPSFSPEIVENKSKAAAGMCSWVINIVKFFDVIQKVGPMRIEQKQASKALEEAQIKLNQVQEKVSKLNQQLATLNAEYNQALNQKNAAIAEAERCARRLNLAQRLVKALSSQNQRWQNSIYMLQDYIKVIVGDVLMSSAFVSYAGPFNKKFRDVMIQNQFVKFFKTNKIPTSKELDPIKLLTDQSLAALWNKQGLPSDKVSIQNGTILINAERYPLMVDPQLQGITWIREKEKNNKLKSLRLGTKQLNHSLEVAVENGHSILIENMDEKIDAVLMPIISRSFFVRGKKKIIKFAGKDLQLHQDFKLFLHTKLSNPHYQPQIQAQTTLINFTVTQDGLCDQLLSLVVKRQRPDLAVKKVQLITQQNDFKIKLKELQDDLLFKLANAQGDILDNIPLIENLEYSKKISVEIAEKVEISKITELKINETSERYRPAASRGALIYFLLSDLCRIHSFYKYSLEAFIEVINRAIDLITPNVKKEARMVDYNVVKGEFGQEDNDEDEQKAVKQEKQKLLEKQEQEKKSERKEISESQKQGQQKKQEGEQVLKKQEQKQKEHKEGQEEQKQQGEEKKQEKEEAEVKEKEQEKELEENSKHKAQLKKISQKDDKEQQEQEQSKQQQDKKSQPKSQHSEKKEKKDEETQQNKNIYQDYDKQEEAMTPRSFNKRVYQLIDSITYTAFQYTRRGLFERHKLIVATMLTVRIQIRQKQLTPQQVQHLFIGKVDPNPPPIPQSLKSFFNDAIWASCKGLETIADFNGFGSNLQSDMLQWKKWYQQQRAQIADLPKNLKQLNKFKRLLLLRALRPDRLTSALNLYVSEIMGQRYIQQPPFNIFESFEEGDKKTPLFFVLFPGVDPTPEVERVAAKYNISIANGRFTNISMGQGQQRLAKDKLFQSGKKGYWIMLQNVHLMQNWLYGINGLQGFLQHVYLNAHPNFRVFISSQPHPLPLQQLIPQSILQSSIKVANQAPQYLKANLRRAYAQFDQEFLDKCQKKPNEFKSCLFALCYFHSLVLGRKKFGSQGWSRIYNFNDGDLTICADVLYNYLSKYDVVPWDDLRYIFGQIMYGGHITDNWDRRTNATYLKVLIKPQLLMPNFSLLYHLFKSPDPAKFDYKAYRVYIEEKLPSEVPQMFGMHPNAEIGYLTQSCQTLCDTILDVEGGSGKGGSGKQEGIMNLLMDFKNRTPSEMNLLQITAKIKEKTPYLVVCLQECERMNILLFEIKKTLQDLRLGLTGALNITDAMESLQTSLQFNKIPVGWEKYAYPSKKGLFLWFSDLLERNQQLIDWSDSLITPKSLCISYLFNPMSFLTAIMQITARQKNLPLDNMTLQTNITYFRGHQEILNPAENGAYIHGIYLEGAAWQNGGQGQDGYLIEQKPKQLHPKLPVVNVISVILKQKKVLGQYQCPVYYTSLRGATYVFTANLNMQSEDSDANKWILSGTCLLMSDD